MMSETSLISPKYKSYTQLLTICLNACLSSFFVGYSLVEAGQLNDRDQQNIWRSYHFPHGEDGWSLQTVRSIVNGAVPIGAILGALLSSQIIKYFSRRNGFLLTNCMAFSAIILLSYVKVWQFFILMRILQGMCSGIYSSITPLYINQIVTPDLANLGSLNQILIAFSQLFCTALTITLQSITDDSFVIWRIVAQFPLLIILTQSAVFIFVFPYQTPKYLYQNGRMQQAAILVNLIYNEDSIEQVFSDYQTKSSRSIIEDDQIVPEIGMVSSVAKKKVFKNSKMAIYFAIHIALFQQMSGVNVIAVYGKNTLQQAINGKEWLKNLATLGRGSASVIASIITIKIMNTKGRKKLIQTGATLCGGCLGALALAFFSKADKPFDQSVPESTVLIIGMIIYMFFFGLTLGPIVWLYIPEIVQPNIIPFSTMTNLIGATACIVGFPLIDKHQINGKPIAYIPFTFLFVWVLVSLFINQRIMVETKEKPREEVFREYKNKKCF